MLSATHCENSRADGASVLEIVDGAENHRRFVPLKRTELHGEVTGPVAGLRLRQVFGFSAAQCDRVVEAAYRFPLPGDAAVLAVLVKFGDVTIRATLKERAAAETEYQQAKQAGRQAALATRESPDVFTLLVAGIAPGQDVTVETLYVQLARPDGAGWSLRIPLTTAPRYVRSDEAGSRHAQGQPLALLRDPGHRFALDLRFLGTGPVASDTHSLILADDGAGRSVRLRDEEVLPDRDCMLRWGPPQSGERPALTVFTHQEPGAEHAYFLALVAPPASRPNDQAVPREAVLLVDHSGSMSGPKWFAADWAVERFLADLGARDTFALGVFHNTTRWFERAPRQAARDAVASAVRFLKQNTDSGGTELGVALEQALALPRGDGERAGHVLVITDAQVSDEGRILRLVDREAERPDRRRVSILCIDAAPNSFLALELAERGGGVARFLTSDPNEEDVTTALDELLADWSAPLYTRLRLHVDQPAVDAAGRSVHADERGSAVDLGDLAAGRPVWVVGRVPAAAAGARFRLVAGDEHVLADCGSSTRCSPEFGPALKALFGARRVLALEHLLHAHADAEELRPALQRLGIALDEAEGASSKKRPVYTENHGRALQQALKAQLVRDALEFGLASAETAFVATREEPGKPVEQCVVVANALPAGWSGDFLASACMSAPPPAARLGVAGGFPKLRSVRRSGSAGRSYGVRADVLSLRNAAPDPASAPSAASPQVDFAVVYSGVPQFDGTAAVLFDSTDQATVLPESLILSRLIVAYPDATLGTIDPSLELAVYLDDLATPRARVRLADLVRLGGERPLNLVRNPGQVVRIVLNDPAGAWSTGAPRLEVTLGW